MVDDVLIVESEEVIGDLATVEKEIAQAALARSGKSDQSKPSKKPVTKVDEPSEDEDLPENLRGKSKKEIADMYANLHSSYGRMANDLGTQRKLTDKLLDLKRETDLSNNGSTKKVEINSSELLENPTAAIEKVVNAATAQTREELAAQELRRQEDALRRAHPDYEAIGNSPEFAAWVNASPLRQRAAAMVAQHGDYSAAFDLLNEYKASQPARKTENPDGDPNKTARESAKQASLESGSQGNSNTKKAGKIYRRADLMRIRTERPDVWDDPSFQNEVMIAYAENRVK